MSHASSGVFAVFPGQGAQHVGMGKELYQEFKAAREVFEEASDSVRVDLKKLCFEGPESDLTLTENTQPCLLATSVAAFRVAQSELGFQPEVVAGHSLGEYSALVAAGALPLAAAIRWVRERGAAMQRAVPAGQGGMAAVMNCDEKIEALCVKASKLASDHRTSGGKAGENPAFTVEAGVWPANFNAPGQIVVAGSADAVAQAVSLIKTDSEFAGAKAIPLAVSAPFHSPLMRLARDHMAKLFTECAASDRPTKLDCAYIPNRTARLTREPGLIFELLVEQVDNPVLWKQSMEVLLNQGFTRGLEFGPGKVLQGLTKRIATPLGKSCTVQSIGDAAGIRGIEAFLKS